ncbi:MAG TPA: type II toxin-antitoxin system prevent-host-death family antitoxin [Chloroflexota bacterium]|nr:type II toxin-antitoxin system prevent-host-death family antitoxin [Chloroflexota bacterium]
MASGDGRDVGIRELKERASAVVRRAAHGETVTITDRGRPVARIVPSLQDENWLDLMIQERRIVPATRDLMEVLASNPPEPLLPGEGSAFDALMELRSDEH